MPDSTLPLIINVNDPARKGLLVSFDETARAETTPGQVRGDVEVSVYIRPVIASATNLRPWDDDFATGDTFVLAVGLPDEAPTAGTWSLGIKTAVTTTISNITAASPTTITTSSPHGLTNGYLVVLSGTNCTPNLDGYVFPVTVTGVDTFQIQAEVTVSGNAGNVDSYDTTGMTALAYNITAAALDTLLSAVSVSNGYPALTVEKPSDGDYVITWDAVSAVPPMVGTGGPLLPASQVIVNQIEEGAATTVALQVVQLRQLNVAQAAPATLTAAAGVTRTYTQTGSAVQNSIVKIAFDAPETYGGLYSITATAAGVTAACGTVSPVATTQQLGLVLANHPEINFQTPGVDDNIIVTTDGVSYYVEFVGTLSGVNSARTINDATVANPTVLTFSADHDFQNGDTITITNSTGITPSLNGSHVFTRTGATTGTIPVNVTVSSGESATAYSTNNNTLTVANVDLLVPKGVTGVINFNTVNLFRAFANTDSESLTMTMSVKRTRSSGESRTLLLADVVLFRSIISTGGLVPSPLDVFPTVDQVLLGYKTGGQFIVNDPDAASGVVFPVDMLLSDGAALIFDNVDNDNTMKLTGANQVSMFIGGVQKIDYTTTTISSGLAYVGTTGTFASTTSLLLGTAGSAVGNIGFRNATSGTITLAPATGALGTVTLTLPAATGTLLYGGGPLGTPSSGTLTNCTGLTVPGGGTGAATLTSNGVLLGNTTSPITATAAGTAYQILRVPAAGGAPAFGLLPSFSAYMATQYTLTATPAKLVFDTENFDKGTWFDTSNNRAVAPVAGVYQFGINLYVAGGTTQTVIFHAYKNGSLIARIATQYTATGFDYVVAGAVMLELAANDYVEIYASDLAGTHWVVGITGVANTTAFWGRLVSAN